MSSLLVNRTNLGSAWFDLLGRLFDVKNPIKPRGISCYEITGVTLFLEDAKQNIIVSDHRALNYRFMVAEWLYIWFGHDDVATIARYNSNIAQFSDNGKDFNGAYGPPVRNQWNRILETLRADPDSRQAVLLIYRVPTGPTKDVPCTLTLQFFVRDGRLDMVTCMRSSDIWLGLPYDVFNFTMLGNMLSAQLDLQLGSFTIHLGSSHLYETNRALAESVLYSEVKHLSSPQLEDVPPLELDDVLRDPTRMTYPDYAHALCYYPNSGYGAPRTRSHWLDYGKVLAAQTKQLAFTQLAYMSHHASDKR